MFRLFLDTIKFTLISLTIIGLQALSIWVAWNFFVADIYVPSMHIKQAIGLGFIIGLFKLNPFRSLRCQ